MKKKLVRKTTLKKKRTMALYNVECTSTGSNMRCTPGC